MDAIASRDLFVGLQKVIDLGLKPLLLTVDHRSANLGTNQLTNGAIVELEGEL